MANSARYFYSTLYCTPILNISYLLKNNYIQNFNGYWDFARIDIFFWLFAALALLYFLKLSLFNIKLQIKFKKLSKLNIEVNS